MSPLVLTLILVTAAALSALVAGLLFGFACVVMPGLATLPDRDFLRAFQVIDRVIQNNQPLFMLVWVGSALSVAAAGVLGVFGPLPGLDRALLVASAVLFIGGVQAPTASINIPLNNQLQATRVDTLDDGGAAEARRRFEPRWNQWNILRTVFAVLTVALLLSVVARL
ncbi:MAG: DUF1772 domain-containing protein [Acidobacteriota bacterium]